jgi:4-amino-4-deoxy-L-arabinose transferase-like glycosyltransferase
MDRARTRIQVGPRRRQWQAPKARCDSFVSQIRFPFSDFGRYFANAHLKLEIRNYILVFAGCVLFHVAGTGTLPLIDRDEPRFAEASREMRQRSNYIVPYFNGQHRFDKPPLTYWAQVASYRLFGENDFAARFPSVIAAALTSTCLFAWGRRIRGDRLAWASAIIFTLCFQTFIHAKAAVADMWLVLFMTTAHWAGYELLGFCNTPSGGSDLAIERFNDLTIHRSGRAWWSFYVSLALAFLAKGPIGFIPLLTLLAFIIITRPPQILRRFGFGRGLLLTIAIISAWAVPACIQTHGEFFRIGIGRHVIGRSIGAMEGHGASSVLVYVLLLPFYFVTVFVSFFPWSVKLPWLVGRVYRKRDAFDQYLLCGIGVTFGIFTLVATKLPHYTLPAFPLLALLLARHWAGSETALSETPSVNGWRPVFKGIAATTACLWLAIAVVLPLMVARLFPAYALFQRSRDFIRSETQFGAVDYVEPSLVWYFRSRTNGFLKPLRRNNLAEFMAQPGSRFVVVPTPIAASAVTSSPDKIKIFATRGFNIAKFQKVDLTLVLKPE